MNTNPADLAATLLKNSDDRDSLGTYKRQLATLSQIYAEILQNSKTWAELLDLAMDSRLTGFAGFQAPAFFMLAESIYICRRAYHSDIDECLGRAKVASHNIQDARFCAKSTIRYNAIRYRWWKWPDNSNIAKTVEELCKNSASPQFSSLHCVGEDYSKRTTQGLNKLPLPQWLREAKTLKEIAQIYQKSVVELQRFNSGRDWEIDTPLPIGTWVNIPDPGFVNLLTGRLSAEILVKSDLSDEERVRLIKALVPLASANSTVLDTVLSRLLIVSRPNVVSILDAIDATVKRYLRDFQTKNHSNFNVGTYKISTNHLPRSNCLPLTSKHVIL